MECNALLLQCFYPRHQVRGAPNLKSSSAEDESFPCRTVYVLWMWFIAAEPTMTKGEGDPGWYGC